MVTSNPRLSVLDSVLSPLKRNTNLLLQVLGSNEHLRVEAIDLDLDLRIFEGDFVADTAVALLEALGRVPGVKVYNKSSPQEAITEACLSSLVKTLGGTDCTEPSPVQLASPCENSRE